MRGNFTGFTGSQNPGKSDIFFKVHSWCHVYHISDSYTHFLSCSLKGHPGWSFFSLALGTCCPLPTSDCQHHSQHMIRGGGWTFSRALALLREGLEWVSGIRDSGEGQSVPSISLLPAKSLLGSSSGPFPYQPAHLASHGHGLVDSYLCLQCPA